MTADRLTAAVWGALGKMLNPLARLCFDSGVGYKEFEDIARQAFVRVALERRASNESRPSTDSDVAMLTGLSRKHVARVREQLANQRTEAPPGRHRAERVLNAWCHDPEFQDDEGNPASLSLRGDGLSWGSLVRKHSGDPRPRTLLRELERVKAVARDADGRLRVIRKSYAPPTFGVDAIEDIAQGIFDHLCTRLHNLRDPPLPLYQRRIVNAELTPNQAAILERNMVVQLDATAESLDGQLNNPPTDRSKSGGRQDVRLGVEIHVFRDPPNGNSPEPLSIPVHRTSAGRRRKRTRDR